MCRLGLAMTGATGALLRGRGEFCLARLVGLRLRRRGELCSVRLAGLRHLVSVGAKGKGRLCLA